jgi:uncharacterized protein YkwD
MLAVVQRSGSMEYGTTSRWGVALALLMTLAACGGGGGGSGDSSAEASGGGAAAGSGSTNNTADAGKTDTTDVADAPAAGTDTDAEPTAGTQGTCGFANFQAEAVRLINQRRAAGASCGTRGSFPPAAALSWDARLATAAYGHSRDMADKNFFSHTGSNGSSASQRVSAAGYTWSAVGENIAAGYGSVSAVVDGWMRSDGHCANLMNARYRHMGLACAASAGSTYGRYWTLNVAAPR